MASLLTEAGGSLGETCVQLQGARTVWKGGGPLDNHTTCQAHFREKHISAARSTSMCLRTMSGVN